MVKYIIIADDDDNIRLLHSLWVQQMCNDEGIECRVDEVEDGDILLQKVNEHPYDLILTDNQMNHKHGLEVIPIFRSMNIKIPIYLISSSNLEGEASKAGATGYLQKDIFIERKIHEIIKKHLT